MNICFIGHLTAGGTENATFLVANSVCKQHNIYILNTCNNTPSFYLKPQIRFDYLGEKNIAKRIIDFSQYLKRNKIDILITVESMTGMISVPAAKLAHCKHIVWEHANYYQNQGSRWIQKVRQLELRTADTYVVLTQKDKKNFIEHFKIKTRLEQIYNIAEPQKDSQYNLKSKTIISVGHIRKIKNFIVIPEVARLVFEKHPDWCWKIYGSIDGEEYENVKAKIELYDLQNKVIFAGRCDDMDAAYQEAAMYVMTSLQEGFPMVLLEAKSNKLPLISFDIETGPDEIIQNGVNGFLVSAYDTEVMADRICELIENEEKRRQFSEKSIIGLERFANEQIIGQWINLIEGLK